MITYIGLVLLGTILGCILGYAVTILSIIRAAIAGGKQYEEFIASLEELRAASAQ